MSWGRVVLGREATAGQQDQQQGLNTIAPYGPAATFLPPKTPQMHVLIQEHLETDAVLLHTLCTPAEMARTACHFLSKGVELKRNASYLISQQNPEVGTFR